MLHVQVVSKLLVTIRTLESEGKSHKVAVKQAYIRCAEALQKKGISVRASIEMADKALAEIGEKI
jgi:hypothetical protein